MYRKVLLHGTRLRSLLQTRIFLIIIYLPTTTYLVVHETEQFFNFHILLLPNIEVQNYTHLVYKWINLQWNIFKIKTTFRSHKIKSWFLTQQPKQDLMQFFNDATLIPKNRNPDFSIGFWVIRMCRVWNTFIWNVHYTLYGNCFFF